MWNFIEQVNEKDRQKKVNQASGIEQDMNQDTVMSMHYGLSDYGRMRYMLQMADLLKIKKKFETQITEEPANKEKYQKEIDKSQAKAKDILKQMETYAQKTKSCGVIAYAQFQSMNGRDKFLQAIKKTGWCARMCSKKHDYKYMKTKWWPEVHRGPEPTVIIWQNL